MGRVVVVDSSKQPRYPSYPRREVQDHLAQDSGRRHTHGICESCATAEVSESEQPSMAESTA